MDQASHGFWSYLVFQNAGWPLAILAGILPDVVGLGPRVASNAINRKPWKTWHTDMGTERVQRITNIIHPMTHSMVVACIAWILVAGVYGPQWWLLAWPLHILFDIFTHRKEYATPFLYPIADVRLHGVHWSRKDFLAVNVLVLTLAYGIFVF